MTREQSLGLIIGLPLGLAAIVACLAFFLVRRKQLQRESDRISKHQTDIRTVRAVPSSNSIMMASSLGITDSNQPGPKPPGKYDRV